MAVYIASATIVLLIIFSVVYYLKKAKNKCSGCPFKNECQKHNENSKDN